MLASAANERLAYLEFHGYKMDVACGWILKQYVVLWCKIATYMNVCSYCWLMHPKFLRSFGTSSYVTVVISDENPISLFAVGDLA